MYYVDIDTSVWASLHKSQSTCPADLRQKPLLFSKCSSEVPLPTEARPVFEISCIFDADAGTLEYAYLSGGAVPPSETVAEIALTGVRPGLALRPWVYLSNPGDAVTVSSAPFLLTESPLAQF